MPAHWSFRVLIVVALIAGWLLGGASAGRMADRIEQPHAVMTVDARFDRPAHCGSGAA